MNLDKLLERSFASLGGLSWASIEQTPDGAATFSSSIDVSPALNPAYFEATVLRAISMYMVSKMNDASLRDAVESLSDIYQWQIKSENIKLPEPVVRSMGTFKPKLVEREPFTIER